jgi:hypothetical protein
LRAPPRASRGRKARRLDRVFGFDGAGVGGVDPGDAPVAVAGPGRAGDGVEHGAQRADFLDQAVVILAQAHELQAIAGYIADSHHRPAGDRAAFDVEVAAGKARQRDREGLAASAQPLHRLIEFLGQFRREPGPEAENSARQRRVGNQRIFALDIRLLGRRAPGDDDLRIRREK